MLKILTVTGASTEEEPAESEGQHYTGDWHQWSSQHKPCSKGNFDVVWAPVKKKMSLRISMVWSNPLHHQFPHKPDNSQLLFSSGKWVSPPSVRSRADPLHSGIAEVSLGGCELSTQSPTEEGDPGLTGSLEQSLEHWISQGGWGYLAFPQVRVIRSLS